MTDELLTVNEAAIILSLNTFTVRKYIKEGKIKAHKIGTGKHSAPYRIWYKDLEAFINGDGEG